MKREYIYAVFAILAVLDRITGNHLKLGTELEKGIGTLGALLLSMGGMIVLSPPLAALFSTVFSPLLTRIGMDPSVIAALFPNDAGGASIAYELSEDALLRAYNGMVVASMFGVTLCMLPMVLKLTAREHREDVLLGLLCGLATMPVGCVVGGLVMGIPFLSLLWNTAPIALLSLLICLGLWKAPNFIKRALDLLGILLTALIFIGLGLGILQSLCGLTPIPDIAPMSEVFLTVGNIALLLAGVFPMLSVLSRLLRRPLLWLGKRLSLDEASVLGIITSLANAIPMYTKTTEMNRKGRVINVAFAVSAGYVIGDHLAFSLAFDATYAAPMVLSKLISGIAAVALAVLLCRKDGKEAPKTAEAAAE
ncbi:MAG: ethanolamine utilization protein EutH [Clostridia bacterium]|nr:ethanolamine utilization protein EutH [Clostridia bacterium]